MPRIARSRVGGVALIALALGLGGCAPDAGPPPADDVQRVEVEGKITEFMASSESGRSFLLDVPGEGLLSIAIPDGRQPLSASGVVVEVPADAEIPEDAAGEFAALTAIVEASGEPLTVVDFLS